MGEEGGTDCFKDDGPLSNHRKRQKKKKQNETKERHFKAEGIFFTVHCGD